MNCFKCGKRKNVRCMCCRCKCPTLNGTEEGTREDPTVLDSVPAGWTIVAEGASFTEGAPRLYARIRGKLTRLERSATCGEQIR